MKKITDADLINAARLASRRAYAPYSRFRVGAAIPLDGSVVSACNVENASYGLTICAERAAIFSAVAAGASKITRIAIAVDSPDVDVSSLAPCGACLQVLSEFMANDGEVLIAGRGKFKLSELLPYAFSLGKSENIEP